MATGPNNAWAGGQSGYLPLIEYWNGSSWTNVTPTSARFHTPNDGSTPSAPPRRQCLGTGQQCHQRLRDALERVGWVKYGFRGYLIMYGLAVESRKNVWAFGMTGDYRPFVRHFNGSRWSAVAMPGVPMAASARWPGTTSTPSARPLVLL